MTEKRKIQFNEDDMTLGDMEEFEEIVGKTFSEAMKRVKVLDDDGNHMKDPDPEAKGKGLYTYTMSMKGMTAIVYLALRKEDPDITLADVRKLRMTDFELENPKDPQSAESDSAETNLNSAPSIEEIGTTLGS